MKRPFLKSRSGRFTRGFTLLEVVITLTIFILLVAAVFGIMNGVLRSVLVLHDNQDHRDQIAAMDAFLTQKLGNLSAPSSLISYRRGAGEGLEQNGIIFGDQHQIIVIDAKLQANGFYTLRLASPTFATSGGGMISPLRMARQSVSQGDSGLVWTPLIRDVKTLHWRFQNSQNGLWAEEWFSENEKPSMVEFTLQLAGELHPATLVVWLPPLLPVTLSLPAPVTVTNPQPAASHGP